MRRKDQRKTQRQKLRINGPLKIDTHTGRERLIRSHSSARFCFELSGNLN